MNEGKDEMPGTARPAVSEPVHVGRVDEGTGTADVWRHEAGTVEVISDGRVILSPLGARKLSGLLDRAAMPGGKRQ